MDGFARLKYNMGPRRATLTDLKTHQKSQKGDRRSREMLEEQKGGWWVGEVAALNAWPKGRRIKTLCTNLFELVKKTPIVYVDYV